MIGVSFMKYGILATRSGAKIFSIMPVVFRKVVDAPRYLPTNQTDPIDTSPLRASAR